MDLRKHRRGLATGVLLLTLLILLLFFLRSHPEDARMQTRVFPVMGTAGRFTVYADTPEKLEEAMNRAQNRVREIETACNIFRADSELSKLNASAFRGEVVCSPLLWELMWEADRFYRLSGGAFDVTVKPLMVLWGFHRKRSTLPSEAEIAALRGKIGWDKVRLNPEKRSVRFLSEGMGIDLGGIAKGFALDKAAEELRKLSIRRAVLDLGGNICCLNPPGSSCRIGVRDGQYPDRILETLSLENRSVATSGDYERYVMIGGKHYTHIMDPRTGKPVSNRLSVTVVTPRGVDSDALSTALFVAGAEAAPEICRRIPSTGVILLERDAGKPSGRKIFRCGELGKTEKTF